MNPSVTRDNDDLSPRTQAAKDEALREAVVSTLRAHVPGSEKLRLTVNYGWLTLAGAVEATTTAHAIEDAISHVGGLTGISNNIILEADDLAKKVFESIERQLTADAKLAVRRISVSIHDRRVILSGHVRTEFERRQVEAAVWLVTGVTAVINRLRISD